MERLVGLFVYSGRDRGQNERSEEHVLKSVVAITVYMQKLKESVVTNVLLQKMSSKRSSNRPLHQKVRGKKCSKCLQTEVATVFFGISLEGKRVFKCLFLRMF